MYGTCFVAECLLQLKLNAASRTASSQKVRGSLLWSSAARAAEVRVALIRSAIQFCWEVYGSDVLWFIPIFEYRFVAALDKYSFALSVVRFFAALRCVLRILEMMFFILRSTPWRFGMKSTMR